MNHIALIAALAGLWLILSGIFKPLLLAFGAASVVLAYIAARRCGPIDETVSPWRYALRGPVYWVWLLIQIGKANYAVMQATLSRDAAVSPIMFTTPLHECTDLGRTIMANSITLTPGTVTVEVHECDALVHALTEEFADLGEEPEMDRRVTDLEKKVAA